jgi:Protein of unknown function (DUF3500)
MQDALQRPCADTIGFVQTICATAQISQPQRRVAPAGVPHPGVWRHQRGDPTLMNYPSFENSTATMTLAQVAKSMPALIGSHSRVLILFMVLLGLCSASAGAAINPNQNGLTGFWYNPTTSGQGFGVNVVADYLGTGQGVLFAGWYTFATTAGGLESQRWYTLQGTVTAGASSMAVVIAQGTGGNFNATPVVAATTVGSGTITFASCTSGSFTYALNDGRSGTIPLTRLAANVTCSADGSTLTNADFALSGTYYTPATSGQGFVLEVNPTAAVAAFGWYTYAPDGQSSGAAGQRWITAQAAYASGATAFNLDLYQSTGGAFDASTTATTSRVGSAFLTFADCNTATLNYTFSAGSSTGLSGSIPLTRLGTAASACSVRTKASGTAAVVATANAFIATLSTSQQSTAVLTYSSTNAKNWSNLPVGSRNGVKLGSLSAVQLAAAYALIDAAVSNTGASLMENIREGDQVIHLTNTSQNWGYDLYYVAMIGTPSTTAPWLLQITGHHLAYNITYNGNAVSATPMFDGVEPPNWTDSASVAHAPLELQRAAVETLASAIQADSSIASAAKLSGTFTDVVMGVGNNGDSNYPFTYPTGTSGRGVAYTSLSATEQSYVKAAIAQWVDTQGSDVASTLLTAYETDAALASTYVGYGVGTGGSADFGANPSGLSAQHSYLRIDGPRVWIEFVVQQGVAFTSQVHYHTIWRDKTADYGAEF